MTRREWVATCALLSSVAVLAAFGIGIGAFVFAFWGGWTAGAIWMWMEG